MRSESSPRSASAPDLETLSRALEIPFCPHSPTCHQSAFLLLDELGIREALYGGAAGGGKSDALLMAALRYVAVPGYAALILRRSFADLALPGAIMDRAKDWLCGKPGVLWNEQSKTFTFPSNTTLTFGYLEIEKDKYRYQSAEFQFCAFDELTQFEESQYRYLFSRLRRLAGSPIPIRMRAGSNPGGAGHDWVKRRFLTSRDPSRAFIPAKSDDNPHLDKAEYDRTLGELHPLDRARLQHGDWEVQPSGGFFERDWFPTLKCSPISPDRVRYWDKAATAGGGDWTAGVRLCKSSGGLWFIEHVVRGQWAGPKREEIIRQTAAADGPGVVVVVEQEPGSGGKDSASDTIRSLAGYPVYRDQVTGDKPTRAKPLAAQAAAGNVRIIEGAWNLDFLDELTAFPTGSHDDQVDAAAGGFNWLARTPIDSVGCY